MSIATVHLSPGNKKRTFTVDCQAAREHGCWPGKPGAILCKALVDLPWAGSSN
jgi:hypothetical protein